MNSGFPESIRAGVESALTFAERTFTGTVPATPSTLRSITRLSGGCVSPAARVETESGTSAFVKWSRGGPAGLFQAEAEGLRQLASAVGGSLRIPEVLGVGDDGDGTGWLLLEFIPSGEPDGHPAGRVGSFGIALGRGLAALHRHDAEAAPADPARGATIGSASGGGYGWRADNFIGPLPQRNTVHGSWADFWCEERLVPQLEQAREAGHFAGRDGEAWEDVLFQLEELLEGAEGDGVSLLHGDFWSGNAYAGAAGEPVVIDPAVYRGHREVDIAMAELFGGFPRDFLPAYREAWPLRPGYERARRGVYQLYPLLVHVNLFGGGYAARASETVRTLLRL